MKKILIVWFITALISCGETTTTVTETTDSTTVTDHTETPNTSASSDTSTVPATDHTSSEACYMQILQRDTMVLHLFTQGDILSGKLNFDNYEKDGSSGPVSGNRKGDVLKLIYTFNSEGMTSVTEEYFRVSGNDLIRGTGDIANKGDTTYFPNPDKIKYNGGTFKRVECTSVPAKYKQ